MSTISGARSARPVAVCVDRPLLSLDRPFTYALPPDLEASVGSLVRVPFHGKQTRGWILGETDDIPDRMLSVRDIVSPVPRFDERGLRLLRWVAERYVAPLATVIGRSSPPRVASEDAAPPRPAGARTPPTPSPPVLASYRSGPELRSAAAGSFILRPAPEDETAVAVELVGATLARGRAAIVAVPEADPLPATAAALVDAFGGRVAVLAGGDRRSRYRTWLDIAAGAHDVVVGTRPAVFAPVGDVGLILVSRESHPGHREDRSPSYHVRDVAIERAAIDGAVCVLSAICPSTESASSHGMLVAPAARRWPPVEVVKPGTEGRAPALVRALRTARRAFVLAPVPGSGLAQVCRRCGSPAACADCGGALRAENEQVRCVVCEAPGRCANCGGGGDFGVRPGGRERVEAWAKRIATVPVRRYGRPRLPSIDGEIIVGGPEAVRDLGPGALDLVAVLDADGAERRPGLAGRERALTTWMEAVAWARPNGRAIVQASSASDPAIQALVRGNPDRFHLDEFARRERAGFPVGAAVFRVAGDDRLEKHLRDLDPITLLSTEGPEGTLCLLALAPDRVPAFGAIARQLAVQGIVSRVDAEPHL